LPHGFLQRGCRALRCDGIGSSTSTRAVLAKSLKGGLFAGLSLERQVEVCELLLKLGACDTDVVKPLHPQSLWNMQLGFLMLLSF
jgi:hypothetical protein